MEHEGSRPDFVAVLRSQLMNGGMGIRSQSMPAQRKVSFWSNFWFETVRDLRGVESLPFNQKEECLMEVWMTEVFPDWEAMSGSSRMRELYYKGAPISLRGDIWKQAIGNELRIDSSLYGELVNIAKERREQCDKDTIYAEKNRLLAKTFKDLHLDVPRTMPQLEFLHENQPFNMSQNITSLLEAFVMLRPDVGYSQGMPFLGAMLLLYMDCEDAFVALTNLINRSRLVHFYQNKVEKVEVYLKAFYELLSKYLPDLFKHFIMLGIEPDMFLINWLMTLYCRVFPVELASRVWDLFVMEGDTTLFGVAVALLALLQDDLLSSDFDGCLHILSQVRKRKIDHDDLINRVRVLALNEEDINEAIQACIGGAWPLQLGRWKSTPRV